MDLVKHHGVNTSMDIRETMQLIESAQDHVVMVKGKRVFIDGDEVGEIEGGRWRHKGRVTPTSGYYLKLKNGINLYRIDATDKFPWHHGAYSYAADLVRQIKYDAPEIMTAFRDEASPE